MRFSRNELLANDIDWFFSYNGRCYHCASFGGIIPDELNDIEYLNSIQNIINDADYVGYEDITIVEEHVDLIIGRNNNLQNHQLSYEEQRQSYIRSFAFMAAKGFYSYDRLHTPNQLTTEEGLRYLLIAYPYHVAANNNYALNTLLKQLDDETFNRLFAWRGNNIP